MGIYVCGLILIFHGSGYEPTKLERNRCNQIKKFCIERGYQKADEIEGYTVGININFNGGGRGGKGERVNVVLVRSMYGCNYCKVVNIETPPSQQRLV